MPLSCYFQLTAFVALCVTGLTKRDTATGKTSQRSPARVWVTHWATCTTSWPLVQTASHLLSQPNLTSESYLFLHNLFKYNNTSNYDLKNDHRAESLSQSKRYFCYCIILHSVVCLCYLVHPLQLNMEPQNCQNEVSQIYTTINNIINQIFNI